MSSTYSPLLRFELIGSGEQAGLWGTTTNQNLGSLVEQAIAGVATITLSTASPYTLTELNGTPDQARCAVLSFIGAPGGATEIVIPAKQKLYVVRNSCGSSLTFKCVGDLGTGVQVDDGNATLVFCNGERALAGLQTTATANMTGPGSSTNNAIVRWNGTSGTNTLNSAATVDDNGAGTFVGSVTVGAQSSTVGGQVSLKESSSQGTNTISLRAPASLGSDVTLTLPDNTGSASQVLTTNGSGTLSWTSPAVGAVTSVNGLTGAVSLSYNNVGAPSTSGSGASGTWGINISGTATYSTYATYDSSGYGIVNTATSQSIGGNKTFTGAASFTTYGSGASFGSSTPNGLFACYVKPGSTSTSAGGLAVQNNGPVAGSVFASDSTSTPLQAFFYGNYGSNTGVGSITTNGSSTAYNTSSDYRLKHDIMDLVGAVDTVKQLKPRQFVWNNDPDNRVVDGFIAHELQAVVQDAVHGEKDAVNEDGMPIYQGIDVSFLVPVLTAALQEALARIEALEAKVG